MEDRIRENGHHSYGRAVSAVSDVNKVGNGNQTKEWDLNTWSWDGDMFTAAPLNSLPSDCRSKQVLPVGSEVAEHIDVLNSVPSRSDGLVLGNGNERRELEKRRRVVVVEEEGLNNEDGSLNLKLGGQCVTEEGQSGKKTKFGGGSSNRAVCQVDDCRVDLSNAKDYHRRHKVCDVHSKATRALVGNVLQRFCQQCSRFHILQEFDEGKRSCRRRLAGHNRRRRKTHPETVVTGTPSNDEGGINYLLISLLRILSNVQSNSTDQPKDQDLISHLLRNLANVAGPVNNNNPTQLLPGSQDLPRNVGTSSGTLAKDPEPNERLEAAPTSEENQKRISRDDALGVNLQNPSSSETALLVSSRVGDLGNALDTTAGRTKQNNFDLNNAYDDSQDCTDDLQITTTPLKEGNTSPTCPLWVYKDPYKSSPPQTSGNSASTSSFSPSSSSGEAQIRTDRIVFKLFGKDPSDFPLGFRNQILDWLSHSPTDIESYIRPGCIILTIYLRMDKSIWDELCCDLSSSLRRLLSLSTDSFWRRGWIYTRVRHRVAFIYNGQVVLDTSLPHNSQRSCRISSIKPVAVSFSEGVRFSVKGFNLSQPTTRLLCALEGKYLVHESCVELIEGADSYIEKNQIQSMSFPCAIPNITGRGFVEVEDHGLNSSFFPFIIAEKDVCFEIRTLESMIEFAENADRGQGGKEEALEARKQALHFIHEMGWLLHKSQLKLRAGKMRHFDLFSFERFRWLVEFSIDHEWCAVVRKLLSILFNNIVDVGQHTSAELALLEIGLLHRAVRQNTVPMVEFLLRYPRGGVSVGSESNQHQHQHEDESYYLFRPDTVGPMGLTPLHIAVSKDGSENVLDALTEDPESVGIKAWTTARDSTGMTPCDYASLRGYHSYINLVQKKINKKSGTGYVVVDIPSNLLSNNINQKLPDGSTLPAKSFQLEKFTRRPQQKHCRLCEQTLVHGSTRTSLSMYKPAMLSMVAIAAVCVCVALLFKSSPEVLFVFQPFRWELLAYGSI